MKPMGIKTARDRQHRAPEPGLLKCGQCGSTRRWSTEEVGTYFRDGWPRCCGRFMTIISKETNRRPRGVRRG
jgi:hypothetical protein